MQASFCYVDQQPEILASIFVQTWFEFTLKIYNTVCCASLDFNDGPLMDSYRNFTIFKDFEESKVKQNIK